MLIFIDDSGDPGFNKIGKGSSEYFVIACIIFNREVEAENTASALKIFLKEYGFSENIEIKFNTSNKLLRKEFIRVSLQFDYKIICIVINKKNFHRKESIGLSENLFSYCIKFILKEIILLSDTQRYVWMVKEIDYLNVI